MQSAWIPVGPTPAALLSRSTMTQMLRARLLSAAIRSTSPTQCRDKMRGSLSMVGTILVSASNHATTKSTSPSTRPEGPRPSERHETFCVSPALRKPSKATLDLTQPQAQRPGQTATVLPDGRLLLVGGVGAD